MVKSRGIFTTKEETAQMDMFSQTNLKKTEENQISFYLLTNTQIAIDVLQSHDEINLKGPMSSILHRHK
jgi:hypothetical protein